MKKVLVATLAAVMVLGSTMTVLAAPSATASDVTVGTVTELEAAIDDTKTTSEAGAVEVTALEATDKAVTTVEDAVVKVVQAANTTADKEHKAEVLAMADIKIPTATVSAANPVDIKIAVADIKALDTVKVLHYNGTEWEEVTVKSVEAGYVTATFTSLSPVAIVKVMEKGADTGVGVSALSVIAAAGLVGTVVSAKKRAK